jgi:hypothetical protein
VSVRPFRALLVVLLVVTGCAKKVPIVTSGALDAKTAASIRAEGVAIAPVVAVQDLPAAPFPPSPALGEIESRMRAGEEHLAVPTVLDPTAPRDAAFLRNEYFGNIRFGGGFIRTGDVALEVRARLIEMGLEAEYRAEGVRWLGEMVPRALTAAGIRVGPPTAAIAPVPERRRVRGLHPDDGTDNLNLPRSELVPVALDAAQTAAVADARWVLVPYLRLYWTHNGGWFLGQTYGSMAGARIEVLAVIYDTTSGRPVWSMPALGRHIQPRKGQPTGAELEQYLLWAEGYTEERLTRGLLK